MRHPHGDSDVDRIDLGDGRQVEGIVDDGFGPIMDTFVDNFLLRGDLGSGCTVYVDGNPVVDVWGGIADSRTNRPWSHDTAAVIFSSTKGILAVCVYRLVQDGLVDLELPMAAYWPEFAHNGKAHITVREAMSHRAGLSSLDADLTLEQVIAWEPVIHALEQQRPLSKPEDGHVYHALTFGWIVGELIRRVTGLTPGEYFHREWGKPLGLRTWIGLPPTERLSVAWMEPPLPDEDSEAARQSALLLENNPVVERSLTMSGAFAFPAADGLVTFNARDIQAAEIPGANGISSAPSLARFYSACVSPRKGAALLTSESIEDALEVQSAGPQITGAPDDGARWGTGFQLSSPPTCPMLGPSSFGHAGAGGQLGFADAAHRVGFAFLSNQMGGYGDARANELTAALRRCLD